MTLSVGIFALITVSAFILGMATTPLLFYFFLVSPAKIHSLTRDRERR
ncbi:MAG: hypothetical protein GY803_03735 [Chloroflexi bacterium]|nr:hypothetical protein [Chloroflexota bacterium]